MRHHVFPAGFWKTSEHQQLMWQFALRSWWNLTEKLQKQSFTYQQLLFFLFVFYKSTTRLFNTQVFVPLISHCLHSWNIQLRWQSSSWNLHTHNDTHEGLSLKLFGTKVAFKKQKRQREKCPQESLREVKMKKAEMHLFQSLCLEVIRWQNCSENLAACPSTEIKYKDTAPSFKVVLLQNLKMQFVRLAKLSEESINTASKNLPKTKHKETSAAEIFLSPRRRAGSSSQLTNCIFNLWY